jgi:DNA-binding transcriptional LysR family regulator
MLDHITYLLRFRMVAERGSMRKAASELNITQPALSRSIAKLEENFGKPLLVRHSRGVEPTAFGARVLSTANRLSRHWELSQADLLHSNEDTTGDLRIVGGPLWRAIVLPSIMGELHTSFPDLVIKIQQSADASSITELVEGNCDMMFGELLDGKRLKKNRLMQRKFVSFYNRIVARETHPLFESVSDDGLIQIGKALDYPWIIYSGDPSYELATIHGTVGQLGRSPDIRVETSSLVAVIKLLQSHDYLCILPEAAVQSIREPCILPLTVDIGRRRIDSGVVFREEMEGWPPLVHLIDLCQAYFENNMGDRP